MGGTWVWRSEDNFGKLVFSFHHGVWDKKKSVASSALRKQNLSWTVISWNKYSMACDFSRLTSFRMGWELLRRCSGSTKHSCEARAQFPLPFTFMLMWCVCNNQWECVCLHPSLAWKLLLEERLRSLKKNMQILKRIGGGGRGETLKFYFQLKSLFSQKWCEAHPCHSNFTSHDGGGSITCVLQSHNTQPVRVIDSSHLLGQQLCGQHRCLGATKISRSLSGKCSSLPSTSETCFQIYHKNVRREVCQVVLKVMARLGLELA